MNWVAPSENHNANGALEKRLRHAAGMTAAELVAERADAAHPNMGLTAWKVGIVRKGDVTVAKNYLREEEITELNRIVVMFRDFAEDQAERRKQVFLRDWQIRLDDFLRFNERNILSGPGKVSHGQAERRAHEQYGKFEERRRQAAEQAGEADALQQFEMAAKQVELLKPAKGRKKQGGKT
jgi:hypothetical protein